MGLLRVRPVHGRDGGEHEDSDERLAFGSALGQVERAAVRVVLDQRAQALERRGTLRGELGRAGLVLELGDQHFQFRGGVLVADALVLPQSRVLLLELLEALEQVGGRVLARRVARRDALGHETLELRVGGAGHVAGSGGEASSALPLPVTRGLRQAQPHRVWWVVAPRASTEHVRSARVQGRVLEAA